MFTKASTYFHHAKYSYFMLFLSFSYCITFLSSDSASRLFQILLIMGSLPIFIFYRREIFRDPMVKILGLVIAIQIISWAYSLYSLPEIANSGPKIDRLAKLFSFFFIAYWLKGKISNVYLLWSCIPIGFFLGCISQSDFINTTLLGLNGERIDYGIKNEQYASMLASISLFISIFLISQTSNFRVSKLIKNREPFKYSTIVLSFISLFSVFVIITTQARQSWLAIVIMMLSLPVYYSYVNSVRSKRKILYFYSALIVLGLIIVQIPIIQERLLRENATLIAIVNGNFHSIPMTSIGIRVNSWIEAIDWIIRSPIIGHDNAAIGQVIQQSDNFPQKVKDLFSHLHSYHIEVLVAYGFLGLSAIYIMYAWLILSIYSMTKSNHNLKPIFFFCLVFTTYWFIVNSFETFNSRSMGVYVHNIMFAGFYTFYLTHSLNKQEN